MTEIVTRKTQHEIFTTILYHLWILLGPDQLRCDKPRPVDKPHSGFIFLFDGLDERTCRPPPLSAIGMIFFFFFYSNEMEHTAYDIQCSLFLFKLKKINQIP